MLNLDHLLTLASGEVSAGCPPCPPCPKGETDVSDTGNLGAATLGPICPPCPPEKQQYAETQLAGGESPLPEPWACQLGHVDFWISDYGIKVCSKCHPKTKQLRIEWEAFQGGGL